MHSSTKQRIRRFWSEGYSKDELIIMYHDKPWREVLSAVKGMKRPERI